MKKFILMLLFLIACNCGSVSKQLSPPDPIIDDPRSVLLTVNCGIDRWSGTGHIVTQGIIVTAAHVLECRTTPNVVYTTANGSKVVLTDFPVIAQENDIAIIFYSSGLNYESLTIGNVEPGNRVCYYPATPKRGQKCGTVLSVEDGNGGIVTTAPVVPGNSGSLLFNNNGEAVGVVVAYSPLFGFGYMSKF